MGLGSIFLLLAFFVLVVLFISRPFFEKKKSSAAHASASIDHDLSSALADRDRILNTLHELDFDYEMGKVPEEDYQQQRQILLEQGVLTLKMLDSLKQAEGTAAGIKHTESEIGTHQQQPVPGAVAGEEGALPVDALLKIVPVDHVTARAFTARPPGRIS